MGRSIAGSCMTSLSRGNARREGFAFLVGINDYLGPPYEPRHTSANTGAEASVLKSEHFLPLLPVELVTYLKPMSVASDLTFLVT